MARSLSSRSGGVGVGDACVGYNYKICSCRPHTLRGKYFLPAIARSGNLGGWRSVLGGARMYGSQLQ